MREASVLKPVTHPMSIEKRYSVKTATSSEPRNIKGAAGATAQQIGAAASDEVRNLIADIEALVDRVGEAADPEVRRVRANVSAALGKTKEALADGAEQIQDQAKEAIDTADRYVRNQPWEAIGIAVVAGLALGYLVSRR